MVRIAGDQIPEDGHEHVPDRMRMLEVVALLQPETDQAREPHKHRPTKQQKKKKKKKIGRGAKK